MTPEMLKYFINYGFFNRGTITITGRTVSYNKGHAEIINTETRTITTSKMLIPLNPKEVVDLGLGEYAANDSFSLYTRGELRFQSGASVRKGDIIIFKSKDYKIISCLDFETHGFFKYIITRTEEQVLND